MVCGVRRWAGHGEGAGTGGLTMRSYIRKVGTNAIYNEGGEFMAGQIAYCAAGAIPSGWLECNGAAVSRTAYATLFAVIGTTYGPGDGATTFQLPDLRGEFLRGADRGRGIDTGRAIGTAQGDAIRNITGGLNGITAGTFEKTGVGALAPQSEYGWRFSAVSAEQAGVQGLGVNFNASRVVPTASENRPRNVALLTIIKYS